MWPHLPTVGNMTDSGNTARRQVYAITAIVGANKAASDDQPIQAAHEVCDERVHDGAARSGPRA
jgi:hypothetical protein